MQNVLTEIKGLKCCFKPSVHSTIFVAEDEDFCRSGRRFLSLRTKILLPSIMCCTIHILIPTKVVQRCSIYMFFHECSRVLHIF